MSEWYREDLAYIHHVGFGEYASQAAPGILETFKQHEISTGLIVDLGCGSGLSAATWVEAGFQVLGIDISPSMIAMARQRVPQAEFRVDSLFKTNIPECVAVVSIGECFNYLFDPDQLDPDQLKGANLNQVFQRIYEALRTGGLFIFDIAEPGQMSTATPVKTFTEGKDWVVLVEKQEDSETRLLTRRIITFRQVGNHYRRDEEIHRQHLYVAEEIARTLQQIGFQVEVQRGYGTFILPSAHAVLVASKSSKSSRVA